MKPHLQVQDTHAMTPATDHQGVVIFPGDPLMSGNISFRGPQQCSFAHTDLVLSHNDLAVSSR